MNSSAGQQPDQVESQPPLLASAGQAVSLFWRVGWKVTAVASVVCFLAFLVARRDDLNRPFGELVLPLVIVWGYCLFTGGWAGIAAGVLAVLWRWCGTSLGRPVADVARGTGSGLSAMARWFGGWLLLPVLGAVTGAAAGAGLCLLALQQLELNGGVHGGGQVAAMFVLSVLAGAAGLGAVMGGLFWGIVAVVLASRRCHRQQQTGSSTGGPPV